MTPAPNQLRTLPDGRTARCIVVFKSSPEGPGVEYLIVGGRDGEGGWMLWVEWDALSEPASESVR